MRRTFASALIATLAAGLAMGAAAPKKTPGVYASVEEAKQAGPDFDIQGEYEGTVEGGGKIGVQVIALGSKAFQAVFLPGGLPGAGWNGKEKVLCQGKLAGDEAVFAPAEGKRKYLGGPPAQFSATVKFPPAGQKDYTATIKDGKLTGKTDAGKAVTAKKVARKSPTLGAKPPAGATVLLAYKPGKAPSLDAWNNTKWQTSPAGCMEIARRSGSNSTKERFSGAWVMHLEFRTPFRPGARGQGRGNSGVFPPGGREVQVLDSFGLDGKANEAGGIYKNYPPRVNMCLPPLSWQTYDITYSPPERGPDGKDKGQASYKIVHNGVTIHEKVPLGRGRSGGLSLQDHGNPVAYRNIWIVVKGDGQK